MAENLEIRPEVREALDAGRPVVALESNIIAHGMPYPRNVETALEAEKILRGSGVVPATVGILKGRLTVGLLADEIVRLGTSREILKASRRDLAYAAAQRLDGSTTVCATLLTCGLAGISAFATGGIGGAHRGSGDSFDVSADLTELARTRVIVVSSGAKAVLDLAKTLEILETLGVPVVGYRTSRFPAFYSRDSGLALSLLAESPDEIVAVYREQQAFGLAQGILVANPIPPEHEIPSERIALYLTQALKELDRRKITGKEVTPFLLGRIVELSGGIALEANIHLLKNNVHLAAEIACSLAAEEDPR